MHALMPPMHMAVQPCHRGIPQSATPQSVMPPPPAQPPQGLWLPMNNFQVLCSLAGPRWDGDAILQQPVISQPAAPPMIRSSLQLQHLQHNELRQQHLQQQVLQRQLQQTRMKVSQPENTNRFVASTGNITSTDKWYCGNNLDAEHSACSVPQEMPDAVIDVEVNQTKAADAKGTDGMSEAACQRRGSM